MKKLISSILLGSMIVSAASATAAFAEDEPMLISSAPAYSVTVNDTALNLGVNTPYSTEKNIMIPLRTVAEALGFKITWDAANQGVNIDNGEVNTTIVIGDDHYYLVSSQAIGMSAPTPLGDAPVIKNDSTFVPVAMFDILLGQNAYTVKDGVIAFGENKTQIPNPFTEYSTVADAQKALSFTAPVPQTLPDGYTLDNVSLMGNDFLQIMYKNGEKELTYRVAKSKDDISGDYNTYSGSQSEKAGNYTVTLKSNGSTANAVWTDGDYSFAVFSSNADTAAIKILIAGLK